MPTASLTRSREGAERLAKPQSFAEPFDVDPPDRRRRASGGLLVTGFGPFEGYPSNPSEELARGCGYESRIVEVSFRGLRDLFDNLDPSQFESLLMLGAHGSATALHLELLAHNWNGKYPDVHGEVCEGPIDPSLPDMLVGTLWQSIDLSELLATRPMKLSYHPGSYFCNRIYYEALVRFPTKRIGFLHVPRAEVFSMASQKESLSRLLELIVATQPGGGRSSGRPRRRREFP